jgi:hypothetical protein
MVRSPKSKESVSSGFAASETSPINSLAERSVAPDAFSIASHEIDELYQRIKDGDGSAVVELRSLSMALRLKMALINFKQSLAV